MATEVLESFDGFCATYYGRIRAFAAERVVAADAGDVALDVLSYAWERREEFGLEQSAWPALVALTIYLRADPCYRGLDPGALVTAPVGPDDPTSIEIAVATGVSRNAARQWLFRAHRELMRTRNPE